MRHDKARFERFRETMLKSDPRGWAYCNYALCNSNLEQRLGELKVPVQFLAGKHDALRTPALVKELVAKVKGARSKRSTAATSCTCRRRRSSPAS